MRRSPAPEPFGSTSAAPQKSRAANCAPGLGKSRLPEMHPGVLREPTWRRPVCLRPRSTHGEAATERKLPPPGPRPKVPWEMSKRNPGLRPGFSLGRTVPGLRPEKYCAGLRPGPICRRKNNRKSDFCNGKSGFLKIAILVPQTTEIDPGTLIFGISASKCIGFLSFRPNPCPGDPVRGLSVW